MKKYYPPLTRVLFCLLLSICARRTSGQIQTERFIATGPNSNGFYEYLPREYSQDSTKTFPLIVFLHGAGQLGNGTTQLPLILQTPIPGLIAKGGFPDSFVVNGKAYEFIVISPQFAAWPGGGDVNDVIQYSMAHYRVDTGRIYLTGLSMGGDATWNYASFSQWAGLLAAIVPISCDSIYYGLAGAEAMAANNLPIFCTHNKDDNLYPCADDIYNVNLVNSVTPHITPTAQFRMFYNSGHDAWDSTYNPKSIFYQGLNIYQWMLLYTRDPGGNTPPPPPPPTITSFTPASGGLGLTVSISGSGFTGANVVSFGGVAASAFTIQSDNQIIAIVGKGASGSVVVTSSSGTATLAGFRYIEAPVINSFTPTSGGLGITVTIRGSGFTGASSVTFGGVGASAFTVVSDSVIAAVVGTGASGDVEVASPGGTAILAGFQFLTAPAINSFTPTSGGLGMTVTIRGSGFTVASSVTFGGVGASAFTVVSDSVISAIVDTGASGSVVVTSPYGTGTLAGFSFTAPPPPLVPLGFVTFTAVPIGSQKPEVQLSWSDSSEVDNRFFLVQRSTDSIQFSTIDTIGAIPGLLTGNPYSEIDPDPLPGSDFYRVLQVHLDGTTSVSPVRKVVNGQGSGVTPSGPEAPGMWLNPNPATTTLYLTIGGTVSESLELRLVDVSGNVLREWIFQKTANNWIQQVEIGDLVAGMYFIQAFGQNWHSAREFIKR
ncbi:MAG TPA: T9SS type A sorting domain-containing protein [Puia sp.]|nr:T9SS type A sorting domain-containing protein [Puia sp.]